MQHLINLSTVKQLNREFLRAGSDVVQTLTFNGSDDKLKNSLGNKITVS